MYIILALSHKVIGQRKPIVEQAKYGNSQNSCIFTGTQIVLSV